MIHPEQLKKKHNIPYTCSRSPIQSRALLQQHRPFVVTGNESSNETISLQVISSDHVFTAFCDNCRPESESIKQASHKSLRRNGKLGIRQNSCLQMTWRVLAHGTRKTDEKGHQKWWNETRCVPNGPHCSYSKTLSATSPRLLLKHKGPKDSVSIDGRLSLWLWCLPRWKDHHIL